MTIVTAVGEGGGAPCAMGRDFTLAGRTTLGATGSGTRTVLVLVRALTRTSSFKFVMLWSVYEHAWIPGPGEHSLALLVGSRG